MASTGSGSGDVVTIEALRAVANLALATDDGLSDVRSQIELELVVVEPAIKAELQRVLALEGDTPPHVRAFQGGRALWGRECGRWDPPLRCPPRDLGLLAAALRAGV
jgi:hypothetical protein